MLKTLKSKLILAFSVIFILLGAVFVTGYLGISNVNSNSQLLISQVQSQTLQPTFYAAVANINQAKSSAQFWMIIMVSAAGFISVPYAFLLQ